MSSVYIASNFPSASEKLDHGLFCWNCFIGYEECARYPMFPFTQLCMSGVFTFGSWMYLSLGGCGHNLVVIWI